MPFSTSVSAYHVAFVCVALPDAINVVDTWTNIVEGLAAEVLLCSSQPIAVQSGVVLKSSSPDDSQLVELAVRRLRQAVDPFHACCFRRFSNVRSYVAVD